MDCLFSFYARPYVFTFYVTVCECHIALKATWLDLTWISATTLNFWQSHHVVYLEYNQCAKQNWTVALHFWAIRKKIVFFSKTGKYRNALFRRWNVFTYSTCVKCAIGSFRFWFDVNDPLFTKIFAKNDFYIFVLSDLDLWPQKLSHSYSCPVSYLHHFEVSTALQFQIHRRHGTDGRTDRRAGAILNARAPHNNNECTV